VTVATVVCYVGKTNAADDDQHGTTSSSPWTTIQYALTNVLDGATIYVNNGTYVENIIFPSVKKIILESLNGVALTTIQGVGTSAAIITINSCLDDTILNGFIITGDNDVYGGGIYIFHSSTTTIQNNTISGNSATDDGGGIYVNSTFKPIIGGETADDASDFNTICDNTSDQIAPNSYPNNYISDYCVDYCIGSTGPVGGGFFT